MFLMRMAKDLTNLELANLLRAIAASYQIKDPIGNKFKIIAYERAADAVEHLSSEAKDLYDEGKLDQIPGVGPSIASHLAEIFKTGKSAHFEEVTKGIPEAVFALIDLPRIGPKTAFKLVLGLGLENSKNPISDLEKKAKEGKVALLEGFGEESQKDILKAISEFKGRDKRMLLPYASEVAEKVIGWLRQSEFVVYVDALGSLRRQVSTIGDVDIAVASKNSSEVIRHFVAYPKTVRVIEKGEKTASILIPSEIQVDLMVVHPDSYGSLLQHFTGSKHHNIALREYALKKGLSLSEYGIREIRPQKSKIKTFQTEEEFYKYLGMDYITPELREDAGEIEAAQNRKLPHLISLSDVKGDLQIHSDFDVETSHDLGESSMEDIVRKANELNYEYIAFTEHNPSKSRHSKAQVLEILKRKREKVMRLNEDLSKIKKEQFNCSEEEARERGVKKVFNSLEIDILPDGRLSVCEEALDLLDFALVSIHSSFRQTKEEVTKRIISALSYPKVKILAHPTARKIGEREGVDGDWVKIFEFCVKNKKFLEINADPMRLDLPDFLVREAKGVGVKFSFGTDSHHKDGLNNMRWGVSVARRGWLEKEDVINTLPLSEFVKIING
jgi:DNA polymerase (family 10)